MSTSTLIKNATIVNEGLRYQATLLIENGHIAKILKDGCPENYPADEIIDAEGCYLLPGVIDCHVHFREPGLTQKADIAHESCAAAAGGVTTIFDMPNTMPQTTTTESYQEKLQLFAEKCCVNYSIFFGATNDNIDILQQLDPQTTCGIKLFMGSSTGNMLVDQEEALRKLFLTAKLPIMTHCEDTATINANMAKAKAEFGEDPSIEQHPNIRSTEACFKSTQLAVKLAQEYHSQLHVAHITTQEELSLFDAQHPNITAEVCIPHLVFSQEDYAKLGGLIKCNPAIKSAEDRKALQAALSNGTICTIGTDHAPHQKSEKQGGAARAVSGMPMVQFSLVTMLELVDNGVLSMETMVQLMSHNPAKRFQIKQRGFIREGYAADLVIVRPNQPWKVDANCIKSKCGWSPMEGHTYNWRIEQTWCNGNVVFTNGKPTSTSAKGQQVYFDR